MRKIIFRGYNKEAGWVYGSLLTDPCSVEILNHDNDGVPIEVDPSTIGQFTGLTDKNGKDVYEGDIIVIRSQYPRIVLWDKVSWALMPVDLYHNEYFWEMNLQHPDKGWWEDFADEIEVIGNIYDVKIKGE